MLQRLFLIPTMIVAWLFGAHAAVSGDDLPFPDLPPHIVVDVETGDILSAEKPFLRWAPASLTKLMTAYTVFKTLELQHLAMDSPVRVSEAAIQQPPSKMGFPIGTVLTVETALKILMVKSANDISVALAEAISGTEEDFILLMNSHARRIGMTDTNFVNPHGLHDPDQYTSARDMAILAHKLTHEFPQHASFFDIPALRFHKRRLRNHNRLIQLFEGTNGMKTGYVCASGYNVVVRTKRDDRHLVAVVFGGRSGLARNVKAAQLLQEGFDAKGGEASYRNVLTVTKPGDVSDEPIDITRKTCPRKYAAQAKPKVRPVEAPKTQDFDGIDTIVLAEREERKKNPLKNLPVPQKRPAYEFIAEVDVNKAPVSSAATQAGSTQQQAKSEKPQNLKKLAAVYFKPVKILRKEERIALGGAFGPNPNSIKHTDGSIYKPTIPVPTKRPALDLAEAKE
ncbi:MAG: D-alanyl-D-alanine carboxypeptidase family protein [Pseudomonadota bacterium]